MPFHNFPDLNHEASGMVTAKRRRSEEENGVDLRSDSLTQLPENIYVFEDPWYPDVFWLPNTKDEEEELAKDWCRLRDLSRESELDVAIGSHGTQI